MRGAAALMVVAVPVFWLLMPWLFDLLLPDYGGRGRRRADRAARRRRSSSSTAGRSRSRSRSGARTSASSRTGSRRSCSSRCSSCSAASGARPARRSRVLVSTVVFARRLDACCSRGSARQSVARAGVGAREGAGRVAGSGRPTSAGRRATRPRSRRFLLARGHEVEVVTTADRAPALEAYPVHWASRSLPRGVRHVRARAARRGRARRADVVYTTGMFGRSALGAALARARRIVLKLTADPAYRARAPLRAVRRRPRRVPARRRRGGCARCARRGTCALRRTSILPERVPRASLAVALGHPSGARRRCCRTRSPRCRRRSRTADELRGAASASTGRRSSSPAGSRRRRPLDVALEALARARRASTSWSRATGPTPSSSSARRRARARRAARFLGPQPAIDGARALRAPATRSCCSSSWENFPHVRRRGARGRDARDRDRGRRRRGGRRATARTGCSSPPGDADALAAAIRRYFGDAELRERLRAAAAALGRARTRPSGSTGGSRRSCASAAAVKPRVLFVGRRRYGLPLAAVRARKFDALAGASTCACSRAPRAGRRSRRAFTLVPPLRPRLLDGVALLRALPFRIARELRAVRPGRRASSRAPYEGVGGARAALLARRAKRRRSTCTATGAPRRGCTARRCAALLSPLADRLARWAVRRADAVRTVSALHHRARARARASSRRRVPAYMDLEPFLGPPRAAARRAGGALRRRARALQGRRRARARRGGSSPRACPSATLRLVGAGRAKTSRATLVERCPERRPGTPRLAPDGGRRRARRRDVPRAPVARREGMGRVVVEAFCRGRPVVGARVGGIADLVEDGVNGLLVEPGDADGARGGARSAFSSDRELRAGSGSRAGRIGSSWSRRRRSTRRDGARSSTGTLAR